MQAMQEAMVALHSGLRGKAEDLLLSLVAQHPEHVDAWVKLATLATQSKRAAVALERFRKVLSLDPNHAEALLWTGVLLSYQGQFHEAIAFLERADEAKPNDLQVIVPLAQCRYQLRQLDRAIDGFDAALRLKPNDPDLLTSRATCFSEGLRFAEAQTDLTAALQRKPAASGFALLGDIHQKLGRSTDALAQSERALRIEPKNLQARLTAANALLSLGRTDEAEVQWNLAEKHAAKLAHFLNAKAKAHLDVGLFDQAHNILLKSMELEPTFGETYYSYLSSKRVTLEDQKLLDRIRGLLSRSDLADQDRLYLLYGLGKAQIDLGDFQNGLKCFDEAAQLRMEITGARPLDRERFKAYFDSQASLYSAEFIRSMRRHGSESNTPIFILGMMRTGTSLMEQILSCHSQIGGAGEQSFWHDHESALRASGSMEFRESQILPLAQKYESILRSAAPGFDRIIDKNPANAMLAGLIAIAFPNSKIINMRRHPVDTALSIWMTPMRTTAPFVSTRGDIVFAIQQYQKLALHWDSAIGQEQFRVIQYEELTHSPEPVLRGVLSFCGVAWESSCLHPEENPRPVLTPSFWQVRQPLYRGSTDRWKQYAPWLGELAQLMP